MRWGWGVGGWHVWWCWSRYTCLSPAPRVSACHRGPDQNVDTGCCQVYFYINSDIPTITRVIIHPFPWQHIWICILTFCEKSDQFMFRLILEVTRMKMRLLVMSACVTVSLAGVRRPRRSIDPPVYGHGGRSARSYEFEETQAQEEYNEYVRAPRQAANTNYGAPGGGGQPAYQGGGRRHGHQIFLTNLFL